MAGGLHLLRYEEGSYTGDVNDAKNPEGQVGGRRGEPQGVFEYRGDDESKRLEYDGEWKEKAAHGYGVMKWQNGDRWEVEGATARYEGDWANGMREGSGKYISKGTGGRYEGEYLNDLKHGKGKYSFSNGDW